MQNADDGKEWKDETAFTDIVRMGTIQRQNNY